MIVHRNLLLLLHQGDRGRGVFFNACAVVGSGLTSSYRVQVSGLMSIDFLTHPNNGMEGNRIAFERLQAQVVRRIRLETGHRRNSPLTRRILPRTAP